MTLALSASAAALVVGSVAFEAVATGRCASLFGPASAAAAVGPTTRIALLVAVAAAEVAHSGPASP